MTQEELKLERVQIHQPLDPLSFAFLVEEGNHDRVYDCTAIRPGIFVPGIGNAGKLRIRIGAEFLKRVAATGKGKKIDLEHKQDMDNEVGVVQDSYYHEAEARLRQQLRLQAMRPRFMDALGFVESRLKAKQIPEVSVEFEKIIVRPAEAFEKPFFDVDMLDAVLEGTALVTKGACGAKDGCGISLCAAELTHLVVAPGDAAGADANKNPLNPAPAVSSLGAPPPMPCGDQTCLQKHAKMEVDLQQATANVKDLTSKLAAAEEKATALAKDNKDLTGTVQSYKDAEKTALLETLQAAAPKGTDLHAVLQLEKGADLKSAPVATIQVALASFKAMGAKPAAEGGGRHTQVTKRDPPKGGQDSATYLQAMRERMGFSNKEGRTRVPAVMEANTRRLMADREV